MATETVTIKRNYKWTEKDEDTGKQEYTGEVLQFSMDVEVELPDVVAEEFSDEFNARFENEAARDTFLRKALINQLKNVGGAHVISKTEQDESEPGITAEDVTAFLADYQVPERKAGRAKTASVSAAALADADVDVAEVEKLAALLGVKVNLTD